MKKRILTIFICFLLLLPGVSSFVHADTPEEPSVQSKAAIIMDLDSGRILYERNAHEAMEPAGLSKLLTVKIALEKLSLSQSLTVTAEDMAAIPSGAATIGLKEGDNLTVEDAIYGTLLASSTETTLVLARAAAGSEAAFVDAMNEKAVTLSCQDSHFGNSYGLSAEGQGVSAYDMALIARYIYQNETMRRALGTESYTFSSSLTFWNANRMLYSWDDMYYSACIGGKNGYLQGFGGNFVCFGECDGVRLIAVVMGADQAEYYYTDAKNLLNYAFLAFSPCEPLDGYELKNVEKEGILLDNFYETVDHALPSYTYSTGVSYLLPTGTAPEDVEKRVTFYDRVENAVAGMISCYYQGEHLGDVPIYLGEKNMGALRFTLPESAFTGRTEVLELPPATAGNAEGHSEDGNPVITEAETGEAQKEDTSAAKKKNAFPWKMVIRIVVILLVIGFGAFFICRWLAVKKERLRRQEENRKWMEEQKVKYSLEEEEDDT